MNDLSSVRAEIKTWERTFRANQGREPTVDDIKQLPDIARKYKLYKKLSKAVSNLAPNQQSTPLLSPSTPTRASRARNDTSSIVAFTSRVVAPTAPLTSFNPFSPQKKNGKERERPEPRIPQPLFNPFASPTKSGPRPHSVDDLESPGSGTLAFGRPASPSAPSSAVSRARKRLRGEPVSPSPMKEKRRKTTAQTALNLPRLSLRPIATFTSQEVSQEESDEDQGSSFVDDSPMKPAGRAFTLLFDEAQPPPNADIFGLKKAFNNAATDVTESNDSVPGFGPVQPLKPLSKIDHESSQSKTARQRSPSLLHSPPHKPSGALQLADSPTEVELGDKEKILAHSRRSRSPLLPPSPPPVVATSKGPGKRKAESKAFNNRKKKKVAKDGNSDDDASDGSDLKTKVKLVDRAQLKRSRTDDDGDPEFDPILDLPHGAPNPNPSPDFEHEDRVEVNLPEKFKEVLDLKTTHWKGQPASENKLVDSLLYGRRTFCYDSKKGEIWDVGEDEDVDEDKREDADDEWAGEPVPWEVAEF